MFKSSKNNQAFTLVELIVVIALIAILALIVFILIDPTKMKQKANDGKVRNDVSEIAGAVAQYWLDYNVQSATGCIWISQIQNPTLDKYFKDDVLPVHPCGGGYKVDIGAVGTTTFLVTGQLCSNKTKYYNSKGIVVNNHCQQQ